MSSNNAKIQNLGRPLRAIISGGGTGGHIFPAISIANEICRRYPDAQILFVGAENRMEMERVPAAGYSIIGLPVMGFDRKRLWRNFKVILRLFSSTTRARKIITDFKPDIVVGVGGFASGPTLKVAQSKHYPTLVQEQNSYAGVTNRMLAKKADAICVAYEGMEKAFPAEKIELTGNPVRPEILNCKLSRHKAKQALGFNPDKPLVLVVGGSLGSLTVNNAVKAALDTFEKKGISLLWQTGKYYADSCIPAAEGRTDIKASAFIDDMATAYRAADLVVARAGASTISELQLLGAAAVLIPSPNVAEDHQTKNARALSDRGAAILIPDSEAVGKLTDTVISLLSNPDQLESMREKVTEMALPDAASKIVDTIEKIIKPS